MPPSWNGFEKSFRQYKEELLNWKDFTSLEPENYVPADVIRISYEPLWLALTILREKRKKQKGLDKNMKKILEVCVSTEGMDLHFSYKEVTKYRRTDAHSIQEFINGFTSRDDKLKSCQEIIILPKISFSDDDWLCITE